MNFLKVLAIMAGFVGAVVLLYGLLAWVVKSDTRLTVFGVLMVVSILVMAAVGVCTGSGWCR